MKKLVLVIMHELSVGGAERVTLNLANNLDRNKYIVHFALFKKKGLFVDYLKEDIIIHDLNAKRVITSSHKLFFLILKLKPNIVFTSITHVNLLVGAFIPFIRVFCVKIMFVTREVNIPSTRATHISRSKKIDWIYKILIRNFDTIIVQSLFMKDDIINYYKVKSSKIVVINNILNTLDIHKSILMNANHGSLFKSNKINVLAVGNLKSQKGFDRLLQIINLVNDNYHFTIIGEGECRDSLENIITELNIKDRVSLLGFKKNPYKYMNKADILVLTSRYEGFPNVILEANACGKFVIAFDCPGVSTEIIKNGINGVLVADGDYESFAQAIYKYANISHSKELILESTQKYKVINTLKQYDNIFLNED